MNNDLLSGGLWSVVTVVGPILLLAMMAFVVIQNRKRTPAQREKTERATKALREEIKQDEAEYDRKH